MNISVGPSQFYRYVTLKVANLITIVVAGVFGFLIAGCQQSTMDDEDKGKVDSGQQEVVILIEPVEPEPLIVDENTITASETASVENDLSVPQADVQDTNNNNPPVSAPHILKNWPYIVVDFDKQVIDIEGVIGINEGWLEQVACSPGTRDHEAVVIAFAKASHIHAALLLLELEPGSPGKWKPTVDDEGVFSGYEVIAPVGPVVNVSVVYTTDDQKQVEVQVSEWIRDHNTGKQLPDNPWIFGGSYIAEDFDGNEFYAADKTGSIIGLVTFGDELLGWSIVLPDQESLAAPEWEANTEVMPTYDTPVILRLRPVD